MAVAKTKYVAEFVHDGGKQVISSGRRGCSVGKQERFADTVGKFLIAEWSEVDIPAEAIAIVVEPDHVAARQAEIIAAEISDLEGRGVESRELFVGQAGGGPALDRGGDDAVQRFAGQHVAPQVVARSLNTAGGCEQRQWIGCRQ